MRYSAALLLLAATSSPAFAKIQLCNEFRYPIHFALAYETADGWVSEGWIDVAPDKCVSDTKHAELTSLYFYAESDPYDKDGKKVSRFWGKGRSFSIKDGPFTFQRADRQQPDARLVSFGPVTMKAPSDLATVKLSEKGTTTTIISTAKSDPKSDPDYVTCEQSSGKEAMAACDRAIASGKYSGDELATLYLDRGVEQGDPNAGLADFSEALRINPKSFRALSNRGATYNELEQYDRALEDLNQAVELKPDYAMAYRNRGDAYRGKGDREHAIADYRKALSLNPKEALREDIQEQLDKLTAGDEKEAGTSKSNEAAPGDANGAD